jgi:hypothetical protein
MSERKRGRPSQGLNTILYIRASQDLIKKLDRLVRKERKANPGMTISRGDIVRQGLYFYLGYRDESVD